MTDIDKAILRRIIRTAISLGFDMKATVKRVKGMGYSESTIRKYYKALTK